jgi:predicted GNAT family acetyltransferase
MNIRLLKSQDTQVLEEYLAPHKAECMFICSNLKATGIEYGGSDFEGEYFGYFDINDQLQGVIVHYWNGNVMMHSKDHDVLEKLILHLKKNISRPIAGILGPNIQAEHVIKKLGLSGLSFGINSNEGLYEINLEALNELSMPSNMRVVSAQDVTKNILIEWMKSYDIEALGALDDETLEKQVKEHWNLRLQKNDAWVLLLDGTPVALSAFNARLSDMVQVGPVWTPPEYRNKGFARLLLAYTLHQEKLKGTKQAILFTDNPAAIKAYLAIGFKKIGNYRLALLEKPINLQEIEFTTSPMATDIDFLTQKINQETPEFGEAHPFAFFIRDERNQIIAGCNGSVIFGSIYTDQLWVHPDHRKKGLGHQLMEAVHDYGRKSGCSMATVATMSFQGAKTFYEKLGYVTDFERPGYTQNSHCIFLKRSL